MKKEFKNIIIIIPIILTSYFLLFFIEIGWLELLVIERSFKVVWNVIHISEMISWIPAIIIYSLSGYLIFRLIESIHKFIWVILSGIFISSIKFYFSYAYFTEHATTVDYVWFYMSFLVPIFSVYFGYIIGNMYENTANKQLNIDAQKARAS